jgi:ribosome-associated protein
LKTKVSKNTKQNAVENLLTVIIDSILDKKGENVISLNLVGLDDAMTDYMIICEGNSSRQVKAIAENIEFKAKSILNERATFKEGYATVEWVLLDYIDVMVHVFQKDKREFYKLEQLWGDAAIITKHLPNEVDLTGAKKM